MTPIADVSKGSIIQFCGKNCLVIDSKIYKPGNLTMFYLLKMMDIKTGQPYEHRFRSSDEVDMPFVVLKKMQYVNQVDDLVILQDAALHEQISLPKTLLGDAIRFLKQGTEVSVRLLNESPVYAEMPYYIEAAIISTEQGPVGNTVRNALKPATIDTGAQVQVPLFCMIGDTIKIDTERGTYVERVRK